MWLEKGKWWGRMKVSLKMVFPHMPTREAFLNRRRGCLIQRIREVSLSRQLPILLWSLWMWTMAWVRWSRAWVGVWVAWGGEGV